MNKENEIYNKNINYKLVNKILDSILMLLSILILLGIICCIYYVIKLNNINTNENNEIIYNKLISNCNEKYMNININYNDIIQEYVNTIYSYIQKKDYDYLYLNLEREYIEKSNITKEQMVEKLDAMSKKGTNLSSYELIKLDKKDAFLCKLGSNELTITIYEYKPGVYSFAFDNFVK